MSVLDSRAVWDYSLVFIQFICKYFQQSGNVQNIMSYFPPFPYIKLSHKISIISISSVSNKVQAHKGLFLIIHYYIHSLWAAQMRLMFQTTQMCFSVMVGGRFFKFPAEFLSGRWNTSLEFLDLKYKTKLTITVI